MATKLNSISPDLVPVGPGGRRPLNRRTIETLAEFVIGLMDVTVPDSDLEPKDAEEDDHGGCEDDGRSGDEGPDGDEGDYGDVDYGHVRVYGLDQMKPISASNPVLS